MVWRQSAQYQLIFLWHLRCTVYPELVSGQSLHLSAINGTVASGFAALFVFHHSAAKFFTKPCLKFLPHLICIALGIAAESPERSGVKRSAVRACSGKPGAERSETQRSEGLQRKARPAGNAQMHFIILHLNHCN